MSTEATVAELRALAYSVRTPRDFSRVQATLTPAKYGRTWCLTDILRLEEEARGPLLDAILGMVKGKSDARKRLDVRVPLRTVSGEALPVTKVRPEGDPPPRFVDADGVGHHLPDQWRAQDRILPATCEADLASEDEMRSAVWLLWTRGWGAAQGGRERERMGAGGRDTWQVLEVAFAAMHPELAPPGLLPDGKGTTSRKREAAPATP